MVCFPSVVCTPYSRTTPVRHSLYFGQLSFVSDHANLDDVSVFNRFSKDTLIHKYRRYNYDIVHDIENILFSSICLGNATHFRFVGYKIHFDI